MAKASAAPRRKIRTAVAPQSLADIEHAEEKRLKEDEEAATALNFVIGGEDVADDFGDFLAALDDGDAALAEGGGDENSTALLRAQLNELAQQPIIAPAEGRLAERRKERMAKYKQTKKAAAQWTPALRQFQNAEQKVFGAEDESVIHATITDLAGSYRPVGSFEADLLRAIGSAGVTEEAARQAHVLRAADPIHAAAIAVKRAKLRRLMIYEQRRNARVRRIKSKAYRKIARKNRLLETARLMKTLDEEDPEMAASIRAELEEKRASMRMLRKHAARKQWGRLAMRFGGKEATREFDRQMQQAMAEKNALNSIVKTGGHGEDDDDSQAATDGEDSASEDADERPFDYRALLSRLESADDASEDEEKEKKRGIDAMPFMRKGLKRRHGEATIAKDQISRLERKVAKLTAKDEFKIDGGKASDDDDDSTCDNARGRRLKKRRPAPSEAEVVAAASALAEDPSSALALMAQQTLHAHNAKKEEKRAKRKEAEALALQALDDEDEEEDEEEAWQPRDGQAAAARRRTAAGGNIETTTRVSLDDDSNYNQAAAAEEQNSGTATEKRGKRTNQPQQHLHREQRVDAPPPRKSPAFSELQIDPTSPRETHQRPSLEAPHAKSPTRRQELGAFHPTRLRGQAVFDLHSSVSDLIQAVAAGSALESSRRQESVIHEAFAAAANEVDDRPTGAVDEGDDSDTPPAMASAGNEQEALDELQRWEARENQEAAAQVAESQQPHMPGWGSWTGAGLKNKAKKNWATAVQQDSEKDPDGSATPAKQPRVFISRKLDPKVAAMLQARQQRPQQKAHLFASPEHYEASKAQPLGPEWNTVDVHRRLVQPEVVIRPGTVIAPLQYRRNYDERQLDSLLDSWQNCQKLARKRITKTRL